MASSDHSSYVKSSGLNVGDVIRSTFTCWELYTRGRSYFIVGRDDEFLYVSNDQGRISNLSSSLSRFEKVGTIENVEKYFQNEYNRHKWMKTNGYM